MTFSLSIFQSSKKKNQRKDTLNNANANIHHCLPTNVDKIRKDFGKIYVQFKIYFYFKYRVNRSDSVSWTFLRGIHWNRFILRSEYIL